MPERSGNEYTRADVDQTEARTQRPSLRLSDETCFARAQAHGEETFTLRAQDKSAPKTIAFWIMKNIETCSEEKLYAALARAIKMRQWPARKTAD